MSALYQYTFRPVFSATGHLEQAIIMSFGCLKHISPRTKCLAIHFNPTNVRAVRSTTLPSAWSGNPATLLELSSLWLLDDTAGAVCPSSGLRTRCCAVSRTALESAVILCIPYQDAAISLQQWQASGNDLASSNGTFSASSAC